MKTKRWTTLAIVLALIVVVAMMAAACGEATTDTTGAGGGGATTLLPDTTTAPEDTTTSVSENGSATTEAAQTTTSAGTSTSLSLPDLSGQKLEVAAVWTSTEQENFMAVLDEFKKLTNAEVTFTSTGNDIATVLGTRIQGNSPPDVAMLPQPGLMLSLIQQNALKPIQDVVGNELSANYAPVFQDLGTVDGTLYGFVFKAANKSTMWYSVPAFQNAGVQPPATWDELLAAAGTLSSSGVTPFSIAGGDGWTLTDWFENIYLQTAGPEKYDQLASHEIPWTDPSVKTALTAMAQIFGQSSWIAGGNSGALQVTFPQSVSQVFGSPQKAAIVFEADFVASVIAGETDAKLGTDANFFPFPMIGSTGGGANGTATTGSTEMSGSTTTVSVDTTATTSPSTTGTTMATGTTAVGGMTDSTALGGVTESTMIGGTTGSTAVGGGATGGGSVVVGGDTAVMMKDSDGAKALMQFFASPEAAQIWVSKGGFTSPNKNVDPNAYPDPILAQAADDLVNAAQVRFDLSDQAPPAFGSTPSQGMWKLLQDFLQNPGNIDQITQQLESAAASAYGQ